MKKVSLELGGNAPFIVFEDTDIEAAVKGAIAAKYRNAGQTCICANRLYVHDSIYDIFTKKLSEATAKLQVGNGVEQGINVGPLINKSGLDKVQRLVADAIEKGAKIEKGGHSMEDLGDLFYAPTVLSNISPSMAVNHEEIFGPVAPIIRFETEKEVIALANDTPFGLAAYFYGNDYARIWRVAEALEYGMVGINTGNISTPLAPFGGVKESGIGREGSKYGMDEFMEMKYMCWGGI